MLCAGCEDAPSKRDLSREKQEIENEELGAVIAVANPSTDICKAVVYVCSGPRSLCASLETDELRQYAAIPPHTRHYTQRMELAACSIDEPWRLYIYRGRASRSRSN